MNEKIRVVCATRTTQQQFFTDTALGRSWVSFRGWADCELLVYPENAIGLPNIYNHAIEEACRQPATLVFMHDDVYLCDLFWRDRVREALAQFAIGGLAGNVRRSPRQPSWLFIDEKFTWDSSENLSGTVGHGRDFPPTNVTVYGRPARECKLLDGVMVFVESQTLAASGLRFDPQFPFHFYDMDFCRQAELKGLRMGTSCISIIHASPGSFNSQAWRAAYVRYLDKYQE